MKLVEVVKAAGDRVGASGQYMWKCFGDNAISIDFNDTEGTVYATAILDTTAQAVRCVTIEVPGYPQAFRWLDPESRVAYYEESTRRGVDPDIAWDAVQYTHVDTEELILEYVKDIGETYYDNLPLPPDQVPTLTDEVETPFTMPMPGTAGGAKFSFGDGFQKDNKMNQYKVKLTVQLEYDIDASSMDEAAEKVREHWEGSKVYHDAGKQISWVDRIVLEESVSRLVEE